MVTLRIDIEHLAEEIDDALASMEAGDEVLLERKGKVVAALTPRAEAKGGLRALAKLRQGDPPLDEDFERDLATARSWLDRMPEEPRWVP
jgi:antitoxin (DNA-binding transcriptional repressor) of toxin-antitoxin stability system